MPFSSAEHETTPGPVSALSTREVIARHARQLFDQRGYAATSVRAVASAAGIDPALVIRYFGSKEELFVHVMGLAEHPGPMLDGPTATLGERLVADALGPDRAELRRHITTLLRATDHDRVRDTLRETIGRLFVETLAQRLDGPDAVLRARLIAAQIGGLIQSWTALADEQLTEADPNRIIELYGRAIQRLIEPPPT